MHGPPTSARVDIVTTDNETLSDAFQFDPPGPSGPTGCYGGYDYPYYGCTGPTWGFTSMNFRMDIKRRASDTGPLLSITGAQGVAGAIVVDDPTNRILHFNVSEATLTAALVPGEYVYDFVMFDNSTPPIRTVLMYGRFGLRHGITGG